MEYEPNAFSCTPTTLEITVVFNIPGGVGANMLEYKVRDTAFKPYLKTKRFISVF